MIFILSSTLGLGISEASYFLTWILLSSIRKDEKHQTEGRALMAVSKYLPSSYQLFKITVFKCLVRIFQQFRLNSCQKSSWLRLLGIDQLLPATRQRWPACFCKKKYICTINLFQMCFVDRSIISNYYLQIAYVVHYRIHINNYLYHLILTSPPQFHEKR